MTVYKNSVKLLLRTITLCPRGVKIIMTEKLNEIDIEVFEKTPEMTPYAGALPFIKMCDRYKSGNVTRNY